MNSSIAFCTKKNKSVSMGHRSAWLNTLLCLSTLLSFNDAMAQTPNDIDKESSLALTHLYKNNPLAKALSERAAAVLVFPNVIKAGLVFGGSYGEGVLIKSGVYVDYYNSVGGSWGFQAGAQSYSYAVLLMTQNAEKYLDKSHGWEIGVGPTIVLVNEGIAKNLSSSTMKDDAYAFIFDQQGLMLGFSIEGTKITQIKR